MVRTDHGGAEALLYFHSDKGERTEELIPMLVDRELRKRRFKHGFPTD
jgi:hypothetical protein